MTIKITAGPNFAQRLVDELQVVQNGDTLHVPTDTQAQLAERALSRMGKPNVKVVWGV